MKKRLLRFAVILLPALLLAQEVFAGGTGGGFIQPLLNFLSETLKGYGGTTIGIGGLAYGLVKGIGQGSLAGLGTGLGLAAGAYYGPDLISGLNSATLFAF